VVWDDVEVLITVMYYWKLGDLAAERPNPALARPKNDGNLVFLSPAVCRASNIQELK
jgi:hypothetical protein